TYASCGGTFISPTVVLTAAHCVKSGWRGLRVAGGHKLNRSLSTDKTAAVVDVVYHESYSGVTHDNDIALVFLAEDDAVRFAGRIKPARLSTDKTLPETTGRATVSGWGALASGGDYPDELREVAVPIID